MALGLGNSGDMHRLGACTAFLAHLAWTLLLSRHGAGYTKNYQAKRLDNTSARDEPYEFILGGSEVRACSGMPRRLPCPLAMCRSELPVLHCPVLFCQQAIPAFEEAVSSMRVGGIRRIEVLGELPQLSYPRDRSERFVSGFK
jgi:hypothetical protein